jgi:hypothetical protein
MRLKCHDMCLHFLGEVSDWGKYHAVKSPKKNRSTNYCVSRDLESREMLFTLSRVW